MTATNMFVQTTTPVVAGPGDGALRDGDDGGHAVRCAADGVDGTGIGPRAPLIGGAALQVVTIVAVILVRRLRFGSTSLVEASPASDEVAPHVALPPEERFAHRLVERANARIVLLRANFGAVHSSKAHFTSRKSRTSIVSSIRSSGVPTSRPGALTAITRSHAARERDSLTVTR